MFSLGSLAQVAGTMKSGEEKMPVLFIGHGSPMNGIEENAFSEQWQELGRKIPTPKFVLCVSAHWLTRGTHVTAMEHPRTIHDFGGFPRELFEVEYPAPGSPELAGETARLVTKTQVGLDHDWGLDHGTWTVVRHMYPNANIPVLQLSIDYHQPAKYHYELARELAALREKGVLIIGSGNMVHNLGMIDWHNPDGGYDWAQEASSRMDRSILDGDHNNLVNYTSNGRAFQLAIPTPEHYLPLLYTLALKEATDPISLFNDKLMMGSLSMTSVRIG